MEIAPDELQAAAATHVKVHHYLFVCLEFCLWMSHQGSNTES